ncbi:hypothetical protein LSI01_19550 [Furfurilactobacillus siliginis]|uniref:Uncharacterized protein n=2 Tax=Furfurilactobacillus siliginis TaxID=348151 RepID=A0A510VRR4_9LACO|nr:hypothetical protein LSI01_19550 [Furfurilactobacillus siliginis]
MAVQVNENDPTAAFNSLLVAGSTLLAYLVLMIAELVLLARKPVRPNNFLPH